MKIKNLIKCFEVRFYTNVYARSYKYEIKDLINIKTDHYLYTSNKKIEHLTKCYKTCLNNFENSFDKFHENRKLK